MRKKTIAYWIRKLGYQIDLWNVYTNKFGLASLTVGCYDERDPFSSYEFYF
jgi:hypothetical protein